MTIIAYKDGIIAADKLAVNNGLKFKLQKLFLYKGEVISLCGDYPRGMQLLEWYKDQTKMLQGASDGQWCRMVVFGKTIKEYENISTPITRAGKILAFGSGRDFALGAMMAGASAVEAIRITSKLCDSCGGGIQVIKL